MNASLSVYTNVGLKLDMEIVPLDSNWLQTDIMHSMCIIFLNHLIDAKFYMRCKQILFVSYYV